MNAQRARPILRYMMTLFSSASLLLCSLAPAQEAADAKNEPFQIKVYRLANASPRNLLNVLDSIFGDERVALAADERTNTVIVRASPQVLEPLGALVLRLDEMPTVPQKPSAQQKRLKQEKTSRRKRSETSSQRPSGKAAQTLEIRCPVPGLTAVRSLVPEGTKVKKGDLLVTLDDSKLAAQLPSREIALETAKSEIIQAEQEFLLSGARDVPAIQSAIEVAKARREHFLAELKLELKAIEGQIAIASEVLRIAQAHQERLAKLRKDRNASAREIDVVGLEVRKAKSELELVVAKKDLLEQHTRPLKMAELELEIKQAESDGARVNLEAAAQRGHAEAQLSAARLKFQLTKAGLERLQKQIARCKIYAPVAGEVRHRNGGQKVSVQEGTSVRQGQPLVTLRIEPPSQ